MSMLFELPAGAERPVQMEALSAGSRRRVRQAQAVAAGVHPLALVITGIRMHPDADRTAHAGDRPTLLLRCGTCWHRRDTHWGFPKCYYGGDSRVTHGDATTVRAWWPACDTYSNSDPALTPAALVLEPVQCRCPHGRDWHSTHGCEARGCGCEVECW